MKAIGLVLAAALATGFAMKAAPAAAASTPVGAIYACYACQNTGDPVVDAALAANPSVAGDGLLFEFKNTSGSAITGGVFSVQGQGYSDTFSLGTVAANTSVIFIPGVDSDGGAHPSQSLFFFSGTTMDTSDGYGSVNDASAFSFAGVQGAKAVTSGVFHPGDPGLIRPYRDNPAYSTSFIGDGPNGDGGCSNCYFGEIAVLTVPATGGVPEVSAWVLMLAGFGLSGLALRRRGALARA